MIDNHSNRPVNEEFRSIEHETRMSRMLEQLLRERFSCRGFLPDSVPRPVIEQMLWLAQLSPSWTNSQPWEVIITEAIGTERFRKALFEHASADIAPGDGPSEPRPDLPFPAAYRGVYNERRREVGRQLYESVGIAHGDRAASARQALENFRLFGAPHVLILTSAADLGTYGAIDCGLYLGNLLLAAQSMGVATIAQAALAAYSPFVRDYFGIPDNRIIVVGASLGFSDETHPANNFRSRRAELKDVVRWVRE